MPTKGTMKRSKNHHKGLMLIHGRIQPPDTCLAYSAIAIAKTRKIATLTQLMRKPSSTSTHRGYIEVTQLAAEPTELTPRRIGDGASESPLAADPVTHHADERPLWSAWLRGIAARAGRSGPRAIADVCVGLDLRVRARSGGRRQRFAVRRSQGGRRVHQGEWGLPQQPVQPTRASSGPQRSPRGGNSPVAMTWRWVPRSESTAEASPTER